MIKTKIKKGIAATLALTGVLTAVPKSVYAEWKKIDDIHYGYMENGSLYKGWKELDYTYSYEGDGISKDNSKEKAWYYFDENGVMKTSCWVQTGGKWYYLRDDGSMAKNCIINGYAIDMFGAWIERLGNINYTQDFVIVPEKKVYPLGTTTFKFDVINNTGDAFESYDYYGYAQKYIDNQWVTMNTKNGNTPAEEIDDDICIALPPPIFIKKVYSSDIDFSVYEEFDVSKPGKYRICFEDRPSYSYMPLEFEIK